MSEKTKQSASEFLKKNAYLLVIGLTFLIVATVILISAVKSDSNAVEVSKTTTSERQTTSEKTSSSERESTSDSESGGTSTKITFQSPLNECTVLKDYTSSTVVFNQTLGVYTGHMGIDFLGEEGDEVFAVCDGKIESIETSYLQGSTITIDHGNGLKTYYNSIEPDENLRQGQTVVKGQTIGYVSDNNRQEYKDGPHLHFEVEKDGERVDPSTYLTLSNK